MPPKSFELLDLLVQLVRWKKQLIAVFLISAVVAYGMIYFFIEEEFESKALILPSGDEDLGGISSLIKGLSGIPAGLGGLKKNSKIDLYNTIIYSRTNLEKTINKFDLINRFDYPDMEKAVKLFKDKIATEITEETAFEIAVTTNNRKLSAEIANYIVEELNKTIIDLNVKKSRDNRLFLEERYSDIKLNLKQAEDSMNIYQKRSGVLQIEDQVKATIETVSRIKSDLNIKEIELTVLKKTFGEGAPQIRNAQYAFEELNKKYDDMLKGKEFESLVLPLNTIPDKAINYLRMYRDVEIYQKMLEFILPLYEQSKFEEQKDIPILQVVDYAVPAVRKSYPPRTIFSLVLAFGTVLLYFLYILFNQNTALRESEKIQFIAKNLFRWRTTE